MHCDVAIIGGGPSGSTAGTFLKKHNPDLNVQIFEREVFPRDHIGESMLPPISKILDEMGVWDKVEAANFPIKVGGTYRWGRSPELWDLEFVPAAEFKDAPRPAKYEGNRRFTAFQVDRAVYDEILLDHAQEMGCAVHEGTKVFRVHSEGERIESLELAGGEKVTARHYVDASGGSGVIRRALNIHSDYPTNLRNIAIWEYWQNADWAVNIGVGGTRIQILSLPYGWIWFIPLSPTRTSIGLVVPADYFKSCGMKAPELFKKAIRDEDIVAGLIKNATSEGPTYTTKDWSFLSSKMSGPNWFLIGESAGFADPILSAGLTLAHGAGREVAFTILELDREKIDSGWLRGQFDSRQSQRIKNHIRFADYWYTANSQFKDLKEYTAKIAKDAGLELSPDKAWQWLAQGGFISEDLKIGTGSYGLSDLKTLSEFLTEIEPDSPLEKFNVFKLNLAGAHWKDRADYRDGAVHPSQCYVRGDRVLPVAGMFGILVDLFQRTSTMDGFVEEIRTMAEPMRSDPKARADFILSALQALEAMVTDGWLTASYDPSMPLQGFKNVTSAIHWNRDAKSASQLEN